jgi:hypothetical protein
VWYRASWRHTFGFVYLCVLLLAGCAGLAWLARSLLLAALVGVAILWMVAVQYRAALCITEDRLIYAGLWSRFEAAWSEIDDVRASRDVAWPRNRWLAPTTFEVRCATRRAAINLLFFDRDANRAFREAVASWREQRRKRASR